MTRVVAAHWADYELIDAGNEHKLERWGNCITIRPDRNAYFQPVLARSVWEKQADFRFHEVGNKSGEWESIHGKPLSDWQISFNGVNLNLKFTKFKHLGVFPEQRYNWDFIKENINEGDRFLNLFAYTGAASLVARKQGADVFHCDSVKQVISWSRENMESSGLDSIHWIHEDALKFAQREVKRGRKYKGIIMDPPAYGVGANKERWKIEDQIEPLMLAASELLDSGSFLIINTYSPRLQEGRLRELCDAHFANDTTEIEKLCVESTTGKTLEYGEISRIIRP